MAWLIPLVTTRWGTRRAFAYFSRQGKRRNHQVVVVSQCGRPVLTDMELAVVSSGRSISKTISLPEGGRSRLLCRTCARTQRLRARVRVDAPCLVDPSATCNQTNARLYCGNACVNDRASRSAHNRGINTPGFARPCIIAAAADWFQWSPIPYLQAPNHDDT